MRVFGRYIVAHPGVNGGRACTERGISASVILSRRLAGETVAELAEDYSISEEGVRAVERYVFAWLGRRLA